jgi:hypothetical protein
MGKKNEKRLCWNCDGNVSLHLAQCPYCGVDLAKDAAHEENAPPFKHSSYDPPSPFAKTLQPNLRVNEEEWNRALEEENEREAKKEELPSTTNREMRALLLLLPGVVFILFGLMLLFFSEDGVLTLKWKQNLAYFYLLGAIPLLILGWRSFK